LIISGGAILSASQRLRSAFDRHGSRPGTCTSRSSLRCSASSDQSSRSDRLFRRFARVWARAGTTPEPEVRTQALVLLQQCTRCVSCHKSLAGSCLRFHQTVSMQQSEAMKSNQKRYRYGSGISQKILPAVDAVMQTRNRTAQQYGRGSQADLLGRWVIVDRGFRPAK